MGDIAYATVDKKLKTKNARSDDFRTIIPPSKASRTSNGSKFCAKYYFYIKVNYPKDTARHNYRTDFNDIKGQLRLTENAILQIGLWYVLMVHKISMKVLRISKKTSRIFLICFYDKYRKEPRFSYLSWEHRVITVIITALVHLESLFLSIAGVTASSPTSQHISRRCNSEHFQKTTAQLYCPSLLTRYL